MTGKTALLVIDVQSAFFDPKDYIYNGEEYLARIRGLVERAREEDVPVVFVQHEEAGSPLARGAPGWAIHPAIAPKQGELVVPKTTPDSFYKTTLQADLKKRGITRLVAAGFQTEWCIDTTVRRAYSLDYPVTLVEDAHSTYDTKILKAPQIIAHHNSIFGGRFAKLAKAEEVDFTRLN
jgi:nicotinamidase-related amidase